MIRNKFGSHGASCSGGLKGFDESVHSISFCFSKGISAGLDGFLELGFLLLDIFPSTGCIIFEIFFG
jgi:hypothetical protein